MQPPMPPPAMEQPYEQQAAYMIPENDYRFFRYSKLALPILLITLGIFVALILLTMWQSRSDIRALKSGIPRDVQTSSAASSTNESGQPRYKRNIRIAVFFIGIILTVATMGVFFADASPVLRARVNYPLGLALFLIGVLAWVAFALDVNNERGTVKCEQIPNQTTVCTHREDLATGCTVFDALSGLFLCLSGILVMSYTYSGDYCREKSMADEADMYYVHRQHQPGLVRNGVSTVRKSITTLALLAALASCVILAIFTIMLSEERESFAFRDSYNRDTQVGTNTQPGWPLKNTKLRYATCALAIVTILFNLIPLTSRVIAYVLGFLYIIYAVMGYVCFGEDIDAVEAAKGLVCPAGFKCSYDRYNACVVLDFIGATLLLIYVIWEFVISKFSRPAVV